VTEEDWKPLCEKAKQIDKEYTETECVVDDTTEKLFISLVSDSSNETESSDYSNSF
jgi:hypothetical protein